MTNPKEKQREYSRLYRARHREKALAHSRKWRAANRAKVYEYELRTLNPAQARARGLRRRARVAGAEGTFTLAEFEALGNACAYCGVECARPTVDHVIPLSRGGSNWISNIVPACGPCNYSKGALTGDEFRRKQKRAA